MGKAYNAAYDFASEAVKLRNAPKEEMLSGIETMIDIVSRNVGNAITKYVETDDTRYIMHVDVCFEVLREFIRLIKEDKTDD